MKRYWAVAFFLAFFLCAAAPAGADTVNLKNGGSVEGIIEKEDDKTVEVNTGFGTVTFKKAQIKDIERSSAEKLRDMARKWDQKREELDSRKKEFE